MRLIDADKIVYSWQIDADGQEHDGVTLQSIIDKMPTIEPEILTCEDCKYADDKPISDGRHWCNLHGFFMYYCSDAERKKE